MEEKILITDTELEKIMLSSVRALPDNPSERGFRPAQIKRALHLRKGKKGVRTYKGRQFILSYLPWRADQLAYNYRPYSLRKKERGV